MTLDVTVTGATYCDGEDAWQPGCGTCGNCGEVLTGRSGWFCAGGSCAKEWRRNHQWTLAKAYALRRDGYRCVKCSAGPHSSSNQRQVEVDHIDPLWGRGRSETGCQHHQENLQTLCKGRRGASGCHQEKTNEDRDAAS